MSAETRYLDEELQLANSKIEHSVIVVDGEMAKRWLTRNVKNRPIRQTIVAKYASDMAEGRWLFAADPIRFNVDGDLIDGQHRLTALTECEGLTLPMLIVRALPRDTQGVMDQGTKRTPGDQLSQLGIKDSNAIAAAVKVLLIWEQGLLFRDSKLQHAISTPHIEQWVADHPDDLSFLADVITEARRNDAPPSIAHAVAIVFGRIDEVATTEFFRLLARGAGTEGHPIVTLDKRLQRISKDRIRLPSRDYIALFICAWNAWRDGRRVTQLLRPRGGRWHESNFPVPR